MTSKTLNKVSLIALTILIVSYFIFNGLNKRYNNNINELNIQETMLNDSINDLEAENSRIEKRITTYLDSINKLNTLINEQEENYINIINDLENEVDEIQALTPIESVSLLSNNLSEELNDSVNLTLYNDSTTKITPLHTKTINIVFSKRNNQIKRIETLTDIIVTKEGIITLQKNVINDKDFQISNLNLELKIKDQTIDIRDKRCKKEIKNAKFKYGVSGTLVGALLIVILL